VCPVLVVFIVLFVLYRVPSVGCAYCFVCSVSCAQCLLCLLFCLFCVVCPVLVVFFVLFMLDCPLLFSLTCIIPYRVLNISWTVIWRRTQLFETYVVVPPHEEFNVFIFCHVYQWTHFTIENLQNLHFWLSYSLTLHLNINII
jgi:hypothetical protein